MEGDVTQEHRRISEASLANLKPFRPGQSGNPGGRPKGRSLTALLRLKLDETDPETGKSVAEEIVEAWVNAAKAGSAIPAIKEILDRTEGKVPDKIKASVDAASVADHTLSVILKVLDDFPDAKIAVARGIKESACDPDGTSDGPGSSDPHGGAGS